MREIKFRGKRKDNGEWVEGYYACRSTHQPFGMRDMHFILVPEYGDWGMSKFKEIEVIPETVGQYTGLNDNTTWKQLTLEEQEFWLKNHKQEEWEGKKIYKGDLVKRIDILNPQEPGAIIEVRFENGGYNICIYYGYNKGFTKWLVLEVIGNKHDNPELMKGEPKC